MMIILKFIEIAPGGDFAFAIRVYDPKSGILCHVGTVWADRIIVSSQPPYLVVTLFTSGNANFVAVVDELDLTLAPPELREKFQAPRTDLRAWEVV
jgi:hypothetical protein